MATKNIPNSKGKLKAQTLLKPTPDQLYTEIHGEIQDSENLRERWANKLDLYHRMRMRIRKVKNFPFPGASNLRLPTAEKWVRKVVASRVQQAWGINPKAVAIPQTPTDIGFANRAEALLDWQTEQQIPNLLSTLTISADKAAEQGFCCVSPVWHFEDSTEQVTLSVSELSLQETMEFFVISKTPESKIQWLFNYLDVDRSESVLDENTESVTSAVQSLISGSPSVSIELKDEIYNGPIVRLFPAEYVIVPSDSPANPQKCRWIAFERYEPIEVVRSMAKNNQVEKEALDWIEVASSIDVKRMTSQEKDLREGIDRVNNQSHMIKIYEWYGWRETKPGVLQMQYALIAPEFHTFLKKPTKHWADHKKFPVVRFNNELIDDRWYSPRGWPELLEDIIKEIDTQHNQKVDNQTIRNAPMFTFRAGIVNPRLVRFAPAQAIPVPGSTPLDDAVKLLNNTNLNAEFSYEREEMLLKTEIQELVGHTDFSLQSVINRRQPRSATEVNQAAFASGLVQTLDALMWSEALSELFTQIFQLDQQFLPEEVYVRITNSPGSEPIKVNRDEIQGKWKIRARGNEQTTNPVVRSQRNRERLSLMVNPITMTTGVVTPQNIYNMLRRLMIDDGELGWEAFISVPPPPQQGPPPAITLMKPNFEDLSPAEQMQVLASAGIEPDVRGRMLKSEQDRLESENNGRASNGRTS